MADSKITALTSIGASTDPANDPLVLVDVSDTSMAATGTTKKVTLNQLLGASGTATLASATITGDLTVDTSTLKVDSANNRVGIVNASPAYPLDVVGNINTDSEIYSLGGRLALYRTAGASYQDWASGQALVWRTVTTVGGAGASELMRLNSTGLGVGTASPDFKFVANGTQAVPSTSGASTTDGSLRIGAPGTGLVIDTGVTAASAVYGWIQARSRTDYSSNFNLVLQPNGGNVGIGQTPSDKFNVRVSPASAAIAGMTVNDSTNVIGLMITGSAYSSFGVGANSGWLYAATNNMSIGPYGAGYVSIVSNGAERIRFAADGNAYMTLQGAVPTIPNNAQMVFNLTSNTNLRISVKGSDGTTRTANITLA